MRFLKKWSAFHVNFLVNAISTTWENTLSLIILFNSLLGRLFRVEVTQLEIVFSIHRINLIKTWILNLQIKYEITLLYNIINSWYIAACSHEYLFPSLNYRYRIVLSIWETTINVEKLVLIARPRKDQWSRRRPNISCRNPHLENDGPFFSLLEWNSFFLNSIFLFGFGEIALELIYR